MRAMAAASCLCWLLLLPLTPSAQSVQITADAVKRHVVRLADDELEGRGAGYKGEKTAAEYIAGEFKKIGLKPVGDKGSYFQNFKFHAYHPPKPWEQLSSRNVIGSIEGSDPNLRKEIVVIGAHYDGQGREGQADPTRQAPPPGTTDIIWNSANDNASSIAALIEIARTLKSQTVAPKRTILFIAFGAEEHGMVGSIYYVNNPVFPIADHVAMINLEKLGREPDKPLSVLGTISSKSWTAAIENAQATTPRKVAPNPIAFPDSDHYPFGSRGVPAVMILVSTSADAHLPSDTSDKLDYDRVAEAGRFAIATLLSVANDDARPVFVASPMLDPGLIGHLATGAEDDISGVPKGQGGLKVTGVITGRPASRAGFREGDLVLVFGERQLLREEPLNVLMGEYQKMLQGKLGLQIPMKVLRDGKMLDLTLDLRP